MASSKEDYILAKNKEYGIDADEDKYSPYFDDYVNQKKYGEWWWNCSSIYPHLVKECSKCEEDTKFYNSLDEEEKYYWNNHSTLREKAMKPKCTPYCLWFDWFEMKRGRKKLCIDTINKK